MVVFSLEMKWPILYTFLIFEIVYCKVNFCYNGYHTLIDNETSISNTMSQYHCPAGLLFKQPLTVHSVHSDSNRFCFKSDVCSGDQWKCGTKSHSANMQLLTNFHQEDYQELLEIEDLENFFGPHCSHSAGKPDELQRNVGENNHLRKKRQTISLDDEKSNLTNEMVKTELMAQTKRMFYFLAGISPESVHSNLRSVQLLQKSAEIIRGSCDPMYLNSKFIDSVVHAFLFLLKEQGTEKVLDVDVDNYELLMKALEVCTSGDSYSLTLTGSRCALELTVDSVEREVEGSTNSIDYRPNFDTFVWGKYDVVIDAVWHIVDFVHGMCFTTFRENINLHHRYQTAMEELFHNTIQIRWSRHSKLTRESQYDNMLMASVNDSMTVLDACVQGSYIGSPFIHRLGRPIQDENLSRKRREVNADKREGDLMDIAYCLKTEKEHRYRVKELRKRQCK